MYGLTKGKHSKACKGQYLINDDERTASCYTCGHTISYNPIPLDIGQAHVLADIKGYGLRSVR